MNTSETKSWTSFGWLNTTQFLGALNDNIFKLLIILFIIGELGQDASKVAPLAGIVFVVPFLLFTAFAGKTADRFSKRNIVVWTKLAEVVVMLVGCTAFIVGSQIFLYVVLFLMAAQSAFFAPAKYGIVPELVEKERISRANGFLESMTYLAIVIGTALGPMLTQITSKRFVLMGSICVALAGVGFFVSLHIRQTPAAGVSERASVFFWRDIWRTLRSIRHEKELLLTVFASAYFLLIGGFIYCNLIPYGMQHLSLSETQSGYLFVVAAVGIGAGAFWAGKLSGRGVEFGVVPLGALCLTFSSAGLGLFSVGLYPVCIFIFLIGLGAGLFIVPIHAFIQLRSPPERRGQILAASSFLGWVGVFLASGVIYLISGMLGVTAAQMFVALSMMTLVLSVVTVILLPDFLVRLICVLLTRLCYRIKVTGIENLPADKSALLVCNHVSFVDPLLLAATQQRRIRFVMDRDFYNIWWLRPICKLMKVIPISTQDGPKQIVSSLKQARRAMDEGFMICIFAEGALTRNGMLRSFRPGFERIVKSSSYKIIPAYIGGAWGSIFSYHHGRPLSRLPEKFPYPVSIHFGKAMPADSSAEQIRQKVTELSCDYFDGLKPARKSLANHFVRTARSNWRKRCISDTTGKRLNYGQTLVSTVALSNKIKEITTKQDKVGILLPSSGAGALANLTVAMLGKVSVNLNYTASEQATKMAIEQCGIKTIISSRGFLEQSGNIKTLPGIVFIEDIVSQIQWSAKLRAYLKAIFLPCSFLAKSKGFSADCLATIIYSSGSSGKAKGIMLSHHNILSNIQAVKMVFKINPDDDVCGVLPLFHSFGYTCTFWLPLISGVSVSFATNPLDAKAVGKIASENKATLLFAAPSFLLNYTRRVQREDFATLRFIMVGAEKLKQRIADCFEDKFGIRPMEGFGTTELSPVVSLNLHHFESAGSYQVGNKQGTVGHPIPGVAVRIIDIESSEPLPLGHEGLITVKGPNVMLGYLGMEKETREVLKDGWYNTGDIGCIDEDGFLKITDRLSRFSKIAGEMVPHLGIEEAYHNALETEERLVAVTSIPDAKKGEELVVLHLDRAGGPDKLHEIITKSELPNIWKPRRDNYIRIEEIPALGSGKLDIMKLKKIALTAKTSSAD